ncbi:MAG: hypothetical protein AAGJ37_00425 [Pseudomonadota bacterium]
MKIWKLICASFILFSLNVNGGLTKGITMAILLDELEHKANAIISNGQNAADNVVNNAAYNAINAIAQVRSEYEGALKQTSDELTRQQRMIFEGLESRIDLLFVNIESEHDKIDDTLDNLAIYLSDTVFLSDEPRISRFLSSVAVHGSSSDTSLLIKFRGKNLNHKKNRLIAHLHENLEITPSEIGDNQIAFTLTREQIEKFSEANKLTLIPIEINIYEDSFFFFSKKKAYKYHVRVVPNYIANAVIHYKEKVTVVTDRQNKTVGGPTGSFESGRTTRRFRDASMNAYPDDGYKINTETVSIDWGGSDHCSGGSTRCTTIPSSNIATASCNIASERGRGGRVSCSYGLSMSFQQYKEEEQVNSFNTEKLKVSYDTPVTWNVPSGKYFDRLELSLFDGRTVILDNEARTELIKFSLDQSSGTAVVSHNLNVDVLD